MTRPGRATRSSEDYCVVFLLGAPYRTAPPVGRSLQFFPAIRAQIGLLEDADALAAGSDVGTLRQVA